MAAKPEAVSAVSVLALPLPLLLLLPLPSLSVFFFALSLYFLSLARSLVSEYDRAWSAHVIMALCPRDYPGLVTCT